MSSRINSLIAILCLLAAGTVWSQDTKGTITGRVTDPSGSVIAGAKVVVTNVGMGTKSDLTTNAEGIYLAPALSPGAYQVEASSAGFKKSIANHRQTRQTGGLTAKVERKGRKKAETSGWIEKQDRLND